MIREDHEFLMDIIEFRLASECMQSQEIGIIDKCSNDCQEPANTTLQLDSTPEAPVNPFTFVENIVPICKYHFHPLVHLVINIEIGYDRRSILIANR